MPSSRQASAPVDGGDGGLVYMSASSMLCLSCPHSQVCRHLVLAGGVADRPVMVQEHSEKDQQDYLRLVHASLTADGTRFKCRGLSSAQIHLPSLVCAMQALRPPAPAQNGLDSAREVHEDHMDAWGLRSLCLDSDDSFSDCGDGGVSDEDWSPEPDPGDLPIAFGASRSAEAISKRLQGLWHLEMWVDQNIPAEVRPANTLGEQAAAGFLGLNNFLNQHVQMRSVNDRMRLQPLRLADIDIDEHGHLKYIGSGSFLRIPAVEYQQKLVLHLGAVYLVDVPQYAPFPDGTPRHFDGADEGLINMGRWLFTYEFLQAFLNQLFAGGATFRGYLRQALLNYDISCVGDTNTAGLQREVRVLRAGFQCGDGRRVGTRGVGQTLYKAFIDAVFDFITLQDINYDSALGCACVRSGTQRGPDVVVYDNACHTLDYVLAREPHLVNSFQFFVDKFHHKGHTACSPYMSHRSDPATAFMNSSVMEQGNR